MAKPSLAPGTCWTLNNEFGPVPVVVLANGLHVANYCSYHSFEFDDGSLLMSVSQGRVGRTGLTARETTARSPYHAGVIDVWVQWGLTPAVRENLRILKVRQEIDVLLVEPPILEALKAEQDEVGKCRTVWLVRRAPNICSSAKFIR